MSGLMNRWLDHSGIENLKYTARIHYEAYMRILDSMDCGVAMAEQVSSNMVLHKLKFNACMEELQKLDPACPTMRLE